MPSQANGSKHFSRNGKAYAGFTSVPGVGRRLFAGDAAVAVLAAEATLVHRWLDRAGFPLLLGLSVFPRLAAAVAVLEFPARQTGDS